MIRAAVVTLCLEERTLNALSRCARKRSGDVLTRMKEEAAVLTAAFEEARAKEREEIASHFDDAVGKCDEFWKGSEIAETIRARGKR